MAKDKTTLILGAILVGGVLYFLLKKPASVGVPVGGPVVSTVGEPRAPTSAYSALSGCQGQMIAMAEQQLGLSRDQLTVRSLRPNDLGLGSIWSVNLANINSWNTVINTTVADNTFICLNSVSYSGTAAESVRVIAGSSVVAEFNIERIPGISTTQTASIPDIIVEQNLPIRIEVYASAVSATDNLIISGTVVEKRGMLVW